METRETKQEWTWEEYVAKTKPSVFKKFVRKFLNRIARLTIFPQIRILAYRTMGIHIGKGVFIGPDCYLDDTFPELIYVEDDVTISFRVTIVVHGEARTRGSTRVSPVFIRRNAFIGTGAIILLGVKIGEGAVVGAGAVVTKDVPDGATVVGIPAKTLDDKETQRHNFD